MIPFFQIPSLGPIQPFGVIVAIGVIVGAWQGRLLVERTFRSTDRFSADDERLLNLWVGDEFRNQVFWCVSMGFVGAHLIDVLFYQDEWYKEPLILIKFWQGISSYGGFIGATLAFFAFTRKAKVPRLEFGDAAIYAILVGWIFGRAACASVHDHLGATTDFFLGVNIPAGFQGLSAGIYHDLGFYEMLLTIPLVVLATIVSRVVRRPGALIALAMVLYPIPRFFLEYLRGETSDPRYSGLTPAQWLSAALFIGGIIFLAYLIRKGPREPRYDEALAQAKTAVAVGETPKKTAAKGTGRKR